MNNKVSVIIPYFNRIDYLERSIGSVINQTYRNWELIIIDDCSKEKFDLIDNHNGKITLLKNEINLGPGLSRQFGVDNSNGEFLCFLDSDDYYHDEFLAKAISEHLNNSDISATYCTSVYSDGKIRERSDESFGDLVTPLICGKRPWATCSLVWKRKCVTRWTSLRTNQDYLFEFQNALLNNKIKHIPEILSVINKNTGQNSDDLVPQKLILANKNKVLCFAFDHLFKYNSLQFPLNKTYLIALNGLKLQLLKSSENFNYYEIKRIKTSINGVYKSNFFWLLYINRIIPFFSIRKIYSEIVIWCVIYFEIK
jgi:glycosyltransferase involved in cell wall biosynthesis